MKSKLKIYYPYNVFYINKHLKWKSSKKLSVGMQKVSIKYLILLIFCFSVYLKCFEGRGDRAPPVSISSSILHEHSFWEIDWWHNQLGHLAGVYFALQSLIFNVAVKIEKWYHCSTCQGESLVKISEKYNFNLGSKELINFNHSL